MTIVTIYQRCGWKLDSYGNGWGYTLTDLATQTSCWFQDEDAAEFRARFDASFELGDDCAMDDMLCEYLPLMEAKL